MNTRGCPYWKFNTTTLREKCKLTGEDVEERVECDFGFEACPHYQKRCKEKQKTQEPPQNSAGNYQQDMFGGEIELSKLNKYQTVNPVDK